MSAPLYFSRARLKASRGEALAPLARALLAGTKGETAAQAHRIVWMLFGEGRESEAVADAGGKNRLFLWREKSPGEFYILSCVPPQNPHGLFALDTQEFSPALAGGDVLRFALRANPVVTRKRPGAEGKGKRDGKGRLRGIRCDIVMDALKPLEGAEARKMRKDLTAEQMMEPAERAKAREVLTAQAARAWMESQGRKAGFELVRKSDAGDEFFLTAANYGAVRIPRLRGRRHDEPATFGVLDLEGLIRVTNPSAFIAKLADGFGKAKAFGCGLMLIRRA